MHSLQESDSWTIPEELGGIGLFGRSPNGEGEWVALNEGELLENPQAINVEGAFALEGQWVWSNDHCAVDSVDLTLCPGELVDWNGLSITESGEYWHHEEIEGQCDVVEFLEVQVAPNYNLSWTEMEADGVMTLTVSQDWEVLSWTYNGTPIDGSNSNDLVVTMDGQYGIEAIHVSSGCTASYQAMFGCLGDVDGDFVVGVSDVLAYLSSFGCQTECGVSDLNGDGAANTSDLLIMLSMFGTICF